jgi:carbamoylphosphate synthase large subunit
MGNYIVLGGSHLQQDFVEKVKKNGFVTHLVDYNPSCDARHVADFFHCISIDDLDGVLRLAYSLEIVGIHAVANELGNITANYVAEKLNLPCNGYQTALNTTDKTRMKRVLRENGLDTPISYEIKSFQELYGYDFCFPVIVKSSDRSAGRGVFLANSNEQLESYYQLAYDESFNKIVLVEEYVEGPQYSIETLCSPDVKQVIAITEMGFSGPPHFVETEHFLPARISDELSLKIRNYALKALEVFNICCGASHIEVRVRANGEITMIEIASRLGGWRHWMIRASYQYDILQGIVNSSVGKPIENLAAKPSNLTIARSIISSSAYQQYLIEKENDSIFIADFVTGEPRHEATNLIEASGFYILKRENNDNSY